MMKSAVGGARQTSPPSTVVAASAAAAAAAATTATTATASSSSSSSFQASDCYVLGKRYDNKEQSNLLKHHTKSLMKFSYRCRFPRMVPYEFTEDTGWGCMIRVAQMLSLIHISEPTRH